MAALERPAAVSSLGPNRASRSLASLLVRPAAVTLEPSVTAVGLGVCTAWSCMSVKAPGCSRLTIGSPCYFLWRGVVQARIRVSVGLIGGTFGSAGAGRAWWLSLQTYCPAGAGTQDRTLRTRVGDLARHS